MSESWQDLLSKLEKESGEQIKGEVERLIAFAKSEKVEYIKACALRLEKHLRQLADKTITPAQFAGYMEDEKLLVQMQMKKAGISQKAAAQRLADGIADTLIENLGRLLAKIIV